VNFFIVCIYKCIYGTVVDMVLTLKFVYDNQGRSQDLGIGGASNDDHMCSAVYQHIKSEPKYHIELLTHVWQ
jgi:hypothetical protein